MTEAEFVNTTDRATRGKLTVRHLKLDADGLCFVKGCNRFGTSLGMCRGHYMRWYRYGHPLALAETYKKSDRAYKPKMRERHAWYAMRNRCCNPKAKNWPRYGGRGIRVCERWQNDFEAFFADMGSKPNATSLERINLDGHYEPGNCIWTTVQEQNRNTSSVRLSVEIVGLAKGRYAAGERCAHIARELGVPAVTLWQALNGRSWKEVEANYGP